MTANYIPVFRTHSDKDSRVLKRRLYSDSDSRVLKRNLQPENKNTDDGSYKQQPAGVQTHQLTSHWQPCLSQAQSVTSPLQFPNTDLTAPNYNKQQKCMPHNGTPNKVRHIVIVIRKPIN